ncbi:MAG: DNA/RNA non-specific endonuclease [Myxococcaceae bacterium]|nr:DNA/RNA non-specific endonuclease [Myxococcaceae bacterium]
MRAALWCTLCACGAVTDLEVMGPEAVQQELRSAEPAKPVRRSGFAEEPKLFRQPVAEAPGAATSVHTTLGLPSAAQVGKLDDWLLTKPQFVVAYDTLHKVPRWVSWELRSVWLGDAPRTSGFRRDPQLPSSAVQASDSEYTNSGYDRGHMCPSADRTATSADNASTFVLTNVVPQTHSSNAGPWAALEDESRDLAALGKRLLVIAGPRFGAGHTTIGNGVEVPLATWKVIVVLEPGTTGVTQATRVIAVDVPNTYSVSGSWRSFRTSVDSIESATGLDLLSDLDPAVEAVVEGRLDTN